MSPRKRQLPEIPPELVGTVHITPIDAISGGPFKEGYNVVSGIDKYLPVDVYVPGCPPRPEALLHGFLTIHAKMERESLRDLRWYKKGEAPEPIPVPELGPDLVDWRLTEKIEAMQQEAQG